MTARLVVPFAAFLLAGCGGINLNPFGPSGPAEVRRDMGAAVEYRCDAQRRFWVRKLDGDAVWLVAPDRELRLAKMSGGGERYGAGRVVLELDGGTAKLEDPPATFANCRVPSAEPEKPAPAPKP